MKKDFEFIKKILETIENNDAPIFYTIDLGKDLFGNEFSNEQNIAYLYNHIQLLGDTDCIENSIDKRSTIQLGTASVQRTQKSIGFTVIALKGLMGSSPVMKSDDRIPTKIKYSHDPLRLTNYGYDLLESLNDNKIMEEIKKSGGKIALESVIGIASSIGSSILLKSIS